MSNWAGGGKPNVLRTLGRCFPPFFDELRVEIFVYRRCSLAMVDFRRANEEILSRRDLPMSLKGFAVIVIPKIRYPQESDDSGPTG